MKSKVQLIHRIISVSVLFVLLLCLTACQESTNSKYERANKLLTEGKYTEAAAIFEEISTYEDASKMSLYTKAINAAETGDYDTAFTTFESLGEFKDCPMMITYYKGRQNEASVYEGAWINGNKWFDAIEIYESIPLFRDSKDRAESCRKAAYDQAIKSGDEGDTTFAISILKELGIYSDAAKQITYYQAVALSNQGDYSGASTTFSTIPGFRDADSRTTSALEDGYKTAAAKEEAGELDEANAIFLNLGEYKDSADRAYKLYYDDGLTKRGNKDWDGARAAFAKAGKYSDAKEQIEETTYQEASDLEASGDYDGAYDLFISLGKYNDSFERANKPYYEMGIAKRNDQDWDGAVTAFEKAGEYEDASTQALAVRYTEGEVKLAEKDWDGAAIAFEKAGDYKDASIKVLAVRYAEGEEKLTAKDWDGAAVAFEKAGEYKDASTQVLEAKYQKADAFEKEGRRSEAHDLFLDLGDYSNSFERAKKPYYEIGIAKREAGEWEDAVAAFIKAGAYSDSEDQIKATRYAEGEAKRTLQDWDGAVLAFQEAGEYEDAAVQINRTKYEKGLSKLTEQDWDGARKAFEEAGSYLDAPEQFYETTYQEAESYYSSGNYCKAFRTFSSIREYKNVNKLLIEDEHFMIMSKHVEKYMTIGNMIYFGKYEQDGRTINGPEHIQWEVLDYDAINNRALLISRYGLETMPYNNTISYHGWESSDIRKWLNDDFFIEAFNAEEKTAILTTMVDNSASTRDKEWQVNIEENNTEDQLFLLSCSEATKYFGIREDYENVKARVAPTENAIIHHAFIVEPAYRRDSCITAEGKPAGQWWLRSFGRYSDQVACVGVDGRLMSHDAYDMKKVVRPAFWIDLYSDVVLLDALD